MDDACVGLAGAFGAPRAVGIAYARVRWAA